MALLRYPGGKSRGALLGEILGWLRPRLRPGVVYGEPFAGGLGVGLAVLKSGLTNRIAIAEADPALHDFWRVVIEDPKGLIQRVRHASPSVEGFLAAKERCLAESGDGFDFLCVNRWSHAGRGVNAGPQGGMKQDRKYLIGCRWNPDRLVREIQDVHNLLAPAIVGRYLDYSDVVADVYYFDPPYRDVGDQLYQFAFDSADHELLATHLERLQSPWLLSYNNAPWVLSRYSGFHVTQTGTSGNGGTKAGSELLICCR